MIPSLKRQLLAWLLGRGAPCVAIGVRENSPTLALQFEKAEVGVLLSMADIAALRDEFADLFRELEAA